MFYFLISLLALLLLLLFLRLSLIFVVFLHHRLPLLHGKCEPQSSRNAKAILGAIYELTNTMKDAP